MKNSFCSGCTPHKKGNNLIKSNLISTITAAQHKGITWSSLIWFQLLKMLHNILHSDLLGHGHGSYIWILSVNIGFCFSFLVSCGVSGDLALDLKLSIRNLFHSKHIGLEKDS